MIRTLYRIDLTISEPWAVGGIPDARTKIDLPTLTTPDGLSYIPATSLVGSLRAHADTIWTPTDVDAHFGSRDPDSTPSGLEVIALGTRIVNGPDRPTVRTTTAINRKRGVAFDRSLRSEHIVRSTACSPSVVHWYLQVPGSVTSTFVDLLTSWTPTIGRRRSIGMGSANVSGVTSVTVDLTAPGALTWWLTDRHTWLADGDALPTGGEASAIDVVCHPVSPPSTERYDLVGTWDLTVVDPLHVGAEPRPTSPDSLPGTESSQSADARTGPPSVVEILYDGDDPEVRRPIVPGTTWKGVFRHRMQHITEALTADGVPAPPDIPWTSRVERLFGTPTDGTGHADSGGWRGILRFTDTVFPAATVDRTHVAIDRFTGGASDGALYTWKAIPCGATATLRIESERGGELDDLDRHLIEWVIGDLHDGLIGVGGGTGRGYGTVQVTQPPQPVPFAWARSNPVETTGGTL